MTPRYRALQIPSCNKRIQVIRLNRLLAVSYAIRFKGHPSNNSMGRNHRSTSPGGLSYPRLFLAEHSHYFASTIDRHQSRVLSSLSIFPLIYARGVPPMRGSQIHAVIGTPPRGDPLSPRGVVYVGRRHVGTYGAEVGDYVLSFHIHPDIP